MKIRYMLMLIESLCKYVFHVFSINLKEKKRNLEIPPHHIYVAYKNVGLLSC